MINHQSKLSVSIGLAAYNEEVNIRNFLVSLCSQNENFFQIKEILVISDGSTDRTVEWARSVADPRIRVIDGRERLGQRVRLNQILVEFSGDVLALFDADVILKDQSVLENLVLPFKRDKNLVLVGGNPQPLPSRTLVGKAVNNLFFAYNLVRRKLRGGLNPYGFRGPILALSWSFAKNLTIPSGLPQDAFLYFTTKVRNLTLHHEEKAVVLFSPPQTVTDQINQGSRFGANKLQLKKYFGASLVDQEYHVPWFLHVRVFLSQVFKNPLAYLFLKLLSVACVFKSRILASSPESKWEIVTSSKNLIESQNHEP